ncbi:MAG: MBL fold metallo-hydrolase [Bacteroidales bacterium]|nr:MBL fold metallo-hydrolase [Bacteroidales bacterium]
MKTKLTFLGTGTSQGVPMIGCDCPVCQSADPRDKRLRASVLVEYEGLTILVDAGPDFRAQMLRENVRHLDAILLTHGHKDHTGGLDDIRSFNLLEGRPINIYCEPNVIESLKREYSYAFAVPRYPGSPEWQVHPVSFDQPFTIHSNALEEHLHWETGKGYYRTPATQEDFDAHPETATVIPVRGWHDRIGKLSVLGYRFGKVAYMTDIASIDEAELEKLKGVEVVTVNCVKRGPHLSHFSLDEAIDFFHKVGARHSYLTHISHLLPCHGELSAELAASGVELAYDGLSIEVE